jgi:hypothetical protein
MKTFIFIIFIIFSTQIIAQDVKKNDTQKESSFIKTEEEKQKDKAKIAAIDLYKVITIDRDTSYIDTTLTIRKEHIFNFLRRDTFGLLPFANEGQAYNSLAFSGANNKINPQFGFLAKHFNYLETNQIKYFSVPTPLTELYFKSVMEQGQSLDAFLTLNTNERLNYAVAYKGLRSFGKYTNTLSSTGNFRFSTNYSTKNGRYRLLAHIAVQDITNGENGGISKNSEFENDGSIFRDRARLQIFTRDAASLLKGNRYFINNSYRINAKQSKNNLFIEHTLALENKQYTYTQPTLLSSLSTTGVPDIFVSRYGDSYVSSNINDTSNFNETKNVVAAVYNSNIAGKLKFFVDNTIFNYFYKTILIQNNTVIPSSLNDKFNIIGGQYVFDRDSWLFDISASNALSNQGVSSIDLNAKYDMNENYSFEFKYQKTNSAPAYNYNFFQSSFVQYNWLNNFKNQKVNSFFAVANTKYLNLQVEYTTLNDMLYFEQKQVANKNILIITPLQFDGTINFLAVKASKTYEYGRFGTDNVVLFQQVQQSKNLLNVPQFVIRNSIYYSDTAFKKAMNFQTGFTLNYFSSYFANEHNPIIGEFFVQNEKKIGNFPMIDFFVNAKVRQTRFYLKAEHFNSAFSKKFYASPSNPYRDFIVRFGLVWNFFQ